MYMLYAHSTGLAPVPTAFARSFRENTSCSLKTPEIPYSMIPCVCSVDHKRLRNVVRASDIASFTTFSFLPHFDVILAQLLNRRTATSLHTAGAREI